MDFNEKKDIPVFLVNDVFASNVLNTDLNVPVQKTYLYARHQTFETKDNIVNIAPTHEDDFFDINKMILRPLLRINEKDKDQLAITRLFLSREHIHHEREIYSLFDMLGDLGGVTEIVMLTFTFFLSPISEHKFNMIAAKRMFLAHTKDKNMFVAPNVNDIKMNKYLDKGRFPKSLSKEELEDIKDNRYIKLSFKDSLCLYLSNNWGGCLVCNCCWFRKRKFKKLFDYTKYKIEKNLDLQKFINYQRLFKHILKNHLLTPDDLFRLNHAERFCIDLDASIDEELCDEEHARFQREADHKKYHLKRQHVRKSVDNFLSITNTKVAHQRKFATAFTKSFSLR